MTESAAPAPPPGPRERRLRLFLIASIALNLLIVGAIAGAMMTWRGHGGRYGGHRGEDYGLMALSRDFPDARRKEFRKQLREERASLRPLWQDVGAARIEAAGVLGTEPYDREAMKQALDKITGAETRLKAAGREMFLKTAEQLTVEERRKLGEWWRIKAERRMMSRAKGKKAEKKQQDAAP